MILDERYTQYLKDESRKEGQAEQIFFPETLSETKDTMEQLKGQSVTVQGARTGLYGAAVPSGGSIVNLTRLKGLTALKQTADGGYELTALSGTTLEEIRTFCRARKSPLLTDEVKGGEDYRRFMKDQAFLFPVEPSEETAAIGGIAATAAKGISLCQFGGIKQYLTALTGLTHGAEWLSCTADQYYQEPDRLPVITSVTLRLIPQPVSRWGIVFFFQESKPALEFGRKIRTMNEKADCIYYHCSTFTMIDRLRSRMMKLAELPEFPAGRQAAVYVEISAEEEETAEAFLLEMMELYMEDDGAEEDTWAASGDEIEKLRQLSHLALEAEGAYFDERKREQPGLEKQSAEFTLPVEQYEAFAERSRLFLEAEGLPFLCFGNLGDSHLHIGVFPKAGENPEVEANREAGAFPECLKAWCREAGGGESDHYGAVSNIRRTGGLP